MHTEIGFESKENRDKYTSEVVEELERLIGRQCEVTVDPLNRESNDEYANSQLEKLYVDLDANPIKSPASVASSLLANIVRRTLEAGHRIVTFSRHHWATSEERIEKEGKRVAVATDLLEFNTNMRNRMIVGVRYTAKPAPNAATSGQ